MVERAAFAVASGQTVVAAARLVGVGERTLRRWMTKPKFRARIRALRNEAFGEAMGLFAGGLANAVRALNGLVLSSDPDVRHRAAVKVAELASRFRQDEDLAARLEQLEAKLAEQQKK